MIKIKNQGYISLHVTEIKELHFTSFHVAFHAYHAFHVLHHISRHFMYHFMSFHHENSFHTHSYHLALKREEKGWYAKLFNRAPPEWGVLIRRIKTPPDWGIFTNDKNATSSRRFISWVQFRPRVPFLTKNSCCTWSNSYPRVMQGLVRDPNLKEESWKPF